MVPRLTGVEGNGPLIPIGARIEEHLATLGKNPAWLAEAILVSRSTISRFLSGERTPSAETLHDVATALGVGVVQLVAGTNAEARVTEARSIVSRREYDEAIAKVVELDRRVNEHADRERKLLDELRYEREAGRRAREDLATCHMDLARARQTARYWEREMARYRDALHRAVADVAKLQASVDAGRTLGGAAAVLAGVAAAVSIANYLKDNEGTLDDDEQE